MKIKTIELEPRPYTIVIIGDVHEGNANYQEESFRKAVKLIQNEADGWIGGGDYVEAINHLDPRFSPKGIHKKYHLSDLDNLPYRQCEYLLDNLYPIKDKCLGLLSGNHEDSLKRHSTFDVVEHLCRELGADNLDQKVWMSLNFRYNDSKSIPYKIVGAHGSGSHGGKREGAATNTVYDIFRWDQADFHFMQHLHRQAIDRAEYNRLEYGTLRREPTYFCVGGCFITKSEEGTDGYFEQRPGKESSIGVIKLTITPHTSGKSKFTHQAQFVWL